MKLKWLGGLLVSLMLLTGHVLASEVALVTTVSGEVSKEAAGTIVGSLDPLNVNDEIVLKSNSSIELVFLDSGSEFQVAGPAKFKVTESGLKALSGKVDQTRVSKVATAIGKLELASADVVQASTRMRSAMGSGAPGKPQGNQMVAPSTFMFPLRGKATFDLYEMGQTKPVFSTETASGRVELPSSVSLKAGIAYFWVTTQNGRMQKREFDIASDDFVSQITSVRPEDDAPQTDKVLYAHLLRQAGFDAEARAYEAESFKR